jgi:hypothetical protein
MIIKSNPTLPDSALWPSGEGVLRPLVPQAYLNACRAAGNNVQADGTEREGSVPVFSYEYVKNNATLGTEKDEDTGKEKPAAWTQLDYYWEAYLSPRATGVYPGDDISPFPDYARGVHDYGYMPFSFNYNGDSHLCLVKPR